MTDQLIDILNDPDGSLNLTAAENADISILKDAENYWINLDSLEKTQETEQPRDSGKRKRKEKWRDLDVNLSDVINLIIANSDRPFFLVRDDKLIYLNASAKRVLDLSSEAKVIDDNFLNLVDPEDWNILTNNIGEMLTEAKQMSIRLKQSNGKSVAVNFQAIYLSDIEHFSFILVGEHIKKTVEPMFTSLYDSLTGLPNFFLFEDRVQTAVTQEIIKEDKNDQRMMIVAAVNIDNIEAFHKMNIEQMIMKKIANNLVLNLQKNATVALGLRYHFWVCIPGLRNKAEVNQQVRQIADILNSGVSDNFTKHDLAFSVGVSCFPQPGYSAKKLIGQAITAIKEAQNSSRNSVEFFVSEEL